MSALSLIKEVASTVVGRATSTLTVGLSALLVLASVGASVSEVPFVDLGQVVKTVHAGSVLGDQTYNMEIITSSPVLDLGVTPYDYDEVGGNWNYKVSWNRKTGVVGNLYINGNLFVRNAKGIGDNYTGYTLQPNKEYTLSYAYTARSRTGKTFVRTIASASFKTLIPGDVFAPIEDEQPVTTNPENPTSLAPAYGYISLITFQNTQIQSSSQSIEGKYSLTARPTSGWVSIDDTNYSDAKIVELADSGTDRYVGAITGTIKSGLSIGNHTVKFGVKTASGAVYSQPLTLSVIADSNPSYGYMNVQWPSYGYQTTAGKNTEVRLYLSNIKPAGFKIDLYKSSQTGSLATLFNSAVPIGDANATLYSGSNSCKVESTNSTPTYACLLTVGIPSTAVTGSDYLLTVTETGSNKSNVSAQFVVTNNGSTATGMNVTFPSYGYQHTAGAVAWIGFDFATAYTPNRFSIDLYQNDSLVANLKSAVPEVTTNYIDRGCYGAQGAGSASFKCVFTFTLPSTVSGVNQFRYKVTETSNNLSAWSPYFTIGGGVAPASKTISITNPSYGYQSTAGQANVVSFIADGFQPSQLNLRLFRASTGATTQATLYYGAADGSINGGASTSTCAYAGTGTKYYCDIRFTMPGSLATASDYYYTVGDTIAGVYADTSKFTITNSTSTTYSPIFYTDFNNYTVGQSTQYKVIGAKPNTSIYWSSTKNGVSTGENCSGYGHVTDSNGNWSGYGGTWAAGDVGSWKKTVYFGDCSGTGYSYPFTVGAVQASVYSPDLNKDNAIDYDDYVYLGKIVNGQIPCPANNACDVNGDKVDNYQDYTAYKTYLYAKYDLNKDGKITAMDWELEGRVFVNSFTCPLVSCDIYPALAPDGKVDIFDWVLLGKVGTTFPEWVDDRGAVVFIIPVQPGSPVQAGGSVNLAWNYKGSPSGFKLELVTSATGVSRTLASNITTSASACNLVGDTYQCAYAAPIPASQAVGNYYFRITENTTLANTTTNEISVIK